MRADLDLAEVISARLETCSAGPDGDPFYVSYVGHPMQGAVAGRIFQLNDPRYQKADFGRNRDYWKGKLRAAAFAWAFSEQFEIGLLSEASIGHIQADFPQQGFTDHVITPSIGLAWMIGEDAIDRYVIRRFEDRVSNKWLRLSLRTGLNPARTFANLMDWKAPWHRDTRAGILKYVPNRGTTPRIDNPQSSSNERRLVAPFEFSVFSNFLAFSKTSCIGGGADVAYRIRDDLQVALTVHGCNLLGLEKNITGDALIYQAGPRWTPFPRARWSPYVNLQVGGMKITQEQFYPEKKAAVDLDYKGLDPQLAYTLHSLYTHHDEANGFAISVGTGVDYKANSALAIRVARIEYMHSNINEVGGMPYSNGRQVSAGMTLRLGTW